jgi:hypothetical protein
VELNISSNLTKSKNLISGKSPPNGLSCSVQVSYTVEALIFLAFAPFALDPLPLRLFLLLFQLLFTISRKIEVLDRLHTS